MRKVVIAIIDYTPLWNTMKIKEVSQYQLLKQGIVDNKTLDTLRKNKTIPIVANSLKRGAGEKLSSKKVFPRIYF